MAYDIDMKKVDLVTFRDFLGERYLIPSRRKLRDGLQQNFAELVKAGLGNLAELQKALLTTKSRDKLAAKTGIAVEYLDLLKREIDTFRVASLPLWDFTIIDEQTLLKLREAGLQTTKDYYDYPEVDSLDLAGDTNDCLRALCGLVRIKGVGALTATMFYRAGLRQYRDFLAYSAEEIVRRITVVNAEKDYHYTKLGMKDVRYVRDIAKLLEKLADKQG